MQYNYYQNKLAVFAIENKYYVPYEVDIAFLGDSLTDMCDLKKFYSEYLCVNRGINGDTTINLEERLKVSVYDLQPKVIVLLIGTNNISTMFNNYERILQGLCSNLPNTKIIQLSLPPMGGIWANSNSQIVPCNNRIKKFADEFNNDYIDIYSMLLDSSIQEINSEYTSDGIHLTNKGYDVISSLIKQTLSMILKK